MRFEGEWASTLRVGQKEEAAGAGSGARGAAVPRLSLATPITHKKQFHFTTIKRGNCECIAT